MESKKALFSLENYRVTESSFCFKGESVDKLGLEFNPSGIYDEGKGVYDLSLHLGISTGSTKIVEIKLDSTYKFKEPLKCELIPDYFYSNCIAIVFPYIRAFISTVSLQANVRPLIIPTLNIQPLGDVLKRATIVK